MISWPFKRVKISGHSMEPAINDGSFLLVNQWAYLFAEPKLGDIVVFIKDGEYFCKRITGINNATGEIRVLGDNPADSLDSRKFGTIIRSSIIGKITKIV